MPSGTPTNVGQGCYWACPITTNAMSGSVIDLKYAFEAKETPAIDNLGAFLQVDWTEKKDTVTATILLLGSGSLFSAPRQGTTVTFTNTTTNDISGNFAVSGTPTVTYGNSKYTVFDLTATKYYTQTGTLP